jgi:hypothetical protein
MFNEEIGLLCKFYRKSLHIEPMFANNKYGTQLIPNQCKDLEV